MKNLIARFVKDESGATAIEYGLIAAGISLAIAARTPSSNADSDAALTRWVCLALMLALVVLACRIASFL